MPDVSRKAFIGELAGGAVLLWLGGCGGGGGSSTAAPQPAAGTCAANIADNHGHVLSIPLSDLDSTTAKTYAIGGNADHSHDVTFTAADFADLKAGRPVSVQSTVTLAHSHAITEACA